LLVWPPAPPLPPLPPLPPWPPAPPSASAEIEPPDRVTWEFEV